MCYRKTTYDVTIYKSDGVLSSSVRTDAHAYVVDMNVSYVWSLASRHLPPLPHQVSNERRGLTRTVEVTDYHASTMGLLPESGSISHGRHQEIFQGGHDNQ